MLSIAAELNSQSNKKLNLNAMITKNEIIEWPTNCHKGALSTFMGKMAYYSMLSVGQTTAINFYELQ
jgi:hypothetical protein